MTSKVSYHSHKFLPRAGLEPATFGIGNQRLTNCTKCQRTCKCITNSCQTIKIKIDCKTTDLNALYRGLYQQTKEHGAKSPSHNIDRPKVVPPFPSTIKYAKLASTFSSSTITWTGKEEKKVHVLFIYKDLTDK